VLLATIIAGVLPFVSTLIAAPLVVSKLEGWSTRAALPWRLAGRSLGRNRARSASVIGATCAVVGLAIALPTFFRSFPLGAEPGDTGSIGSIVSQPDAPPYIAANQVTLIRGNDVAPDALGNIPEQHGPPPVSQPVDEATARQVRGVVANARRVDLEELRRPDGFGVAFELDVFDGKFAHASFGQTPPIAVATPELLDLFGVHQRERHNLASGDVLVIRPAGASVHLARQHPQPSEFYDALHVTGVVVSGEVSFALPRYLLNPATAQRLGWHSVPAGETVFAAPHPLTKHQRAQLSLLSSDNQWAAIHGPQPAPGSSYDYTTIDWGQPRNRVPAPWLLRLAAFGAVALFVLAVVGIGLGLSARDTRDETEVLDAVGAPPVLRRKVSTRRAALLVVVACVIALPAALVPVAAMAATTTRVDAAFRIDWLALAAAMIGLPLVVAFATAAGARVRDLVRPLQPSVLSYTDS
jgi:hypothetical protein